jgi:hypothetical protein
VNLKLEATLLMARLFQGALGAKLRNPLFILGCARSGTTLLMELLSHHADIANLSEANDIWDPSGYPWRFSKHETAPIWVDPVRYTDRWRRDNQSRLKTIRSVFGAYQWFHGKRFFLNKTPLNTFRIPQLLETFPDARLIHMVRDGRATVNSYTRKQIGDIESRPEPYRALGLPTSFDELALMLARFWKANLEEVARRDDELELSRRNIMLDVTYEALCNDRKSVLERICKHTGLELERFTPAAWKLEVKNQNHKWKERFDEHLLARLEKSMEPQLTEWGYR